MTVGIHMGTNCAPLLADLFLYSYEADLIQGFLKKNEKKLAISSNFTFRYINDVLSLSKSTFGDFFHRIYPIELEIKNTTDTDRSASYLGLHLEIDFNFTNMYTWFRSFLLAATLYQGNPDGNHKLLNIVSTEIYILHMQVLLETTDMFHLS
jgi:hypothetical protein